ncbi:MAG: nucleotidyltransferase family protein [Sulfitobacter sp.]
MIAILLLAAGSSSRMRGRDKLLEDVDGVPLLRRQAQRAISTGHPVFVTLPAASHARYETLEDLDITPVMVADADEGMNASLRAGIDALPTTAEAALVMLADMPDITEFDIRKILQAIDLKSGTRIWRAMTEAGKAGHPVVFHATLFPELCTLTGDAGGKAIVDANRDKTVFVTLPQDHARTDLDTPEAWAAWRAQRSAPD